MTSLSIPYPFGNPPAVPVCGVLACLTEFHSQLLFPGCCDTRKIAIKKVFAFFMKRCMIIFALQIVPFESSSIAQLLRG